jgi:hypothetical protein
LTQPFEKMATTKTKRKNVDDEGNQQQEGGEGKGIKTTKLITEIKQEQNNYSPYPYSGVYFSYKVPDNVKQLENFLSNEKNLKDAKDYLGRLLEKLYPAVDEKSTVFFVYPIPGDAKHDNFLNWIKITQFVINFHEKNWPSGLFTTQENESTVYKHLKDSPFVNFHPGNPHMQWRWLWSNKEEDGNNIWKSIEPVSKNSNGNISINEDNGKVVYSRGNMSRWLRKENMIPIDPTNDNFIILQYLSPSDISSSRFVQGNEDSEYSYCGDIQLSWELASKKHEAGNFQKCQRQYNNQANLLKKYNIRPGASRSLPKEDLRDIVQLMTTKPVSLQTLKKETEAIDWVLGKRRDQFNEIQKERELEMKKVESFVKESKNVREANLRKRKTLSEDIALLYSPSDVRKNSESGEKKLRTASSTFVPKSLSIVPSLTEFITYNPSESSSSSTIVPVSTLSSLLTRPI